MENLKSGIGIWQILKESVITDIIAKAGFDFTLLDLEHGQHTLSSIQECIYAAKASRLNTIVRVPQIDYQSLVQIIDTGVDGILFPHVETCNQINDIVSQTLLPPNGQKSFSPFVPRYEFGHTQVNKKKDPLLGILIESKLGLKNLDDLLDNSFVDFIYFGAYDLSVEIGLPGQIFSEEIKEQLIKLNEAAKKYNKKVFSIFRNKEELKFLQSLMIEYPISSVDTSHLFQKLSSEVQKYNSII